MRLLPFIIILFLIGWVMPASAHSLGIARITMTADAGFIDISARVASAVEPVSPVWPSPCKPVHETIAPVSEGIYRYRAQLRCGTTQAGHEIQFEWPVTGALLAVRAAGNERLSFLAGGPEGVRVPVAQLSAANIGTWQNASRYIVVGAEHIWFGIDHLLFVTLLVFLIAEPWVLAKTITAFTLGHSFTLALSIFGFMTVPGQIVEPLIALSIVLLAADIIRLKKGHAGFSAQYPWIVAAGFGLVHGLGFAGAMTELGIPRDEIPFALLFFNIGVELGQIAYVAFLLAMAASFVIMTGSAPMRSRGQLPQLPAAMLLGSAYLTGGWATFWFVERLGLAGGLS